MKKIFNNSFYRKLYEYKLYRFFIDNFRFIIKNNYNKKEVNKNICENIEWIKEMNININFFTENKPLWISWFARLKNAEHFLYKCIKSHIDFYDEIILVDNMSSDSTKEICLKLKKEYPKKIKFYEYKYEVFQVNTIKHKKTLINSINSLAYYYNWCLSKTKYKYVWKIDDDNFIIKNKFKKLRNKIIKENKNNTYYYYSWLNTVYKNWKFNSINNIDYKYSWYFWDHWIFPINKYTYFINNDLCELFIHNLKIKWQWIIFIHLKFLKPNYWFNTIEKNTWKNHIKKIRDIILKKSNFINNILKNENIISYME